MIKLKERLRNPQERNEFLNIIEKLYEMDESNLEVLEVLAALYNEMNKDDGLRRSLSRLFNLYLASEKYQKAADTLERILDVDPYGAGHHDRLLNLEGHIDSIWYSNILSRTEPPSSTRTSPAMNLAAAATEEAESLEDSLVEGETYHQYQLTARLGVDRGKSLNRLFPGAEEKNQRVHDLYEAAEYTPKFKAPAAAPVAPTPRPDAISPGVASFQSLEDLRKISEINREHLSRVDPARNTPGRRH